MPASSSDEIRAEADRILSSGLAEILSEHGEVHVIGSYALKLMTWRDLDIHLVRDPVNVDSFFALGSSVATLLQPHKMHFRDERAIKTPGLPAGLYWGVYLGDERAGAWKIDIWLTDRAGFEPVQRFGDDLAARLTEETRRIILAIKQAAWRHREYRRGFTSSDIYAAVLDRGVRDEAAFWKELEAAKGIGR